MKVTLYFFNREYTTFLKGVCMLLIMISHATNSFSFGRPFTPLGGIGVAVFLIVSGYGINESVKKAGFKDFWVKRIIKVWMPYVIAVATVLVLTGKVDSWDKGIYSIFFIERPYWFIPYIFECYFAYWAITKYFRKFSYECWTVLIVLSIAFISVPLKSGPVKY